MDVSLDTFESLTGWSMGTGITGATCNHRNLIASWNDASLIFSIPSGSKNKTITKTYVTPIPLADYDNIVFNFKSFYLGNNDFRKKSDAVYSIQFGDGVSYYFPSNEQFTPVIIPVGTKTHIDSITFTCLTDFEDAIVISDLRGVKDELPIDLLTAAQKSIEWHIDRIMGNGIAIGTVTAEPGDTTIQIAGNWDFTEIFAVIKITDGTNTETHQLSNAITGKVEFNSMYDGKSILHRYTNAQVYITAPVVIGRFDKEIVLPGAMIWYTSPEPAPLTARLSEEIISMTDLVFYLVRDGLRYKWSLVIDNEARSPELVAYITTAIRAFFAESIIWICGRKYTFEWDQTAVDTDPVDAYDIIPKTVYTVSITIIESVFSTITLPIYQSADYIFIPSGA